MLRERSVQIANETAVQKIKGSVVCSDKVECSIWHFDLGLPHVVRVHGFNEISSTERQETVPVRFAKMQVKFRPSHALSLRRSLEIGSKRWQ